MSGNDEAMEDGGTANTEIYATSMSLRDWFAGQALNGLSAMPGWVKGLDKFARDRGLTFKDALAGQCYEMADAMLAERERRR